MSVSFQRLSLSDQITEFQGLLNYARLLSDTRFWEAVLHTAIITSWPCRSSSSSACCWPIHFLADRALKRHLRGAAHHSLGDLADGRRLDVAADVRQPLRPDQPDHRLDRRPSTSRSSGRSTSASVYPAIIICEVWQWTPFMFLMLLAALSNVDQAQLEAAEIDGAACWQAFRNITCRRSGR